METNLKCRMYVSGNRTRQLILLGISVYVEFFPKLHHTTNPLSNILICYKILLPKLKPGASMPHPYMLHPYLCKLFTTSKLTWWLIYKADFPLFEYEQELLEISFVNSLITY